MLSRQHHVGLLSVYALYALLRNIEMKNSLFLPCIIIIWFWQNENEKISQTDFNENIFIQQFVFILASLFVVALTRFPSSSISIRIQLNDIIFIIFSSLYNQIHSQFPIISNSMRWYSYWFALFCLWKMHRLSFVVHQKWQWKCIS